MKKISKILTFILAAALSATCLFACGGEDDAAGKGVVSIEKTASEGLTDTYTITYTDGSTDSFTVQNGANGTDGKDSDGVTAAELFAAYKAEHPTATYEEFLSVLSVSVDETTTAAHKALQSSLRVYTEFTERSSSGGWHAQTQEKTVHYQGSAVVYEIDEDYTYLITNYHVIYDEDAVTNSKYAKRIVCYLYGSDGAPTENTDADSAYEYDYGEYGIECDYVGGSATADIAILKTETDKIKAINEDVAAVEFADGYHVGQTAIAVGNSNGEGISVTKGIVSVDNEYISLSVDGTTRSYRSIRIDTALYEGNSGGGLFDVDGKLIGITNAGAVDDQNINYAIPLSIVKNVAENIMAYQGAAKKITLGVTVYGENSKYVYDATSGSAAIVEDVIIKEITKNSIAEELGLAAGDRLTCLKINGVGYAADRYFSLGDILYAAREGDELSICYERAGEQKETNAYTVRATDLKTVE